MSEKVRLRKFGFRLVIMLAFVFLFGAVTVWATPRPIPTGTLEVTKEGDTAKLLLTMNEVHGNESHFIPNGNVWFLYSTRENTWNTVNGIFSLDNNHQASASVSLEPGKEYRFKAEYRQDEYMDNADIYGDKIIDLKVPNVTKNVTTHQAGDDCRDIKFELTSNEDATAYYLISKNPLNNEYITSAEALKNASKSSHDNIEYYGNWNLQKDNKVEIYKLVNYERGDKVYIALAYEDRSGNITDVDYFNISLLDDSEAFVYIEGNAVYGNTLLAKIADAIGEFNGKTIEYTWTLTPEQGDPVTIKKRCRADIREIL